MAKKSTFTYKVAAIVALGGLLMGFDASVVSGVNKFVQIDFDLTDPQLGWSVSSLTLVAAIAMLFAGPISDRYGRRIVLKACAIIFTISAVGSALAPSYILFLLFRMLGGIGVGASLILAPMYIAEIAPPKVRGAMVSFNQLNIVIGISLALVTNYIIVSLGNSDATWVESLGIAEHNWRWMLVLEALPAVFYYFGLLGVPRSPRWLVMQGRDEEAIQVMTLFRTEEEATSDITEVKTSLEADANKIKATLGDLFKPAFSLVLIIGLVVGVLQQITGINAVFFYAPMIFEQTGGGTDAAFLQSVIVGIVNLVFTIFAMSVIDKFGRKLLLLIGVSGITLFLFLIGYSFSQATYRLDGDKLDAIVMSLNDNDGKEPEFVLDASKLQGVVGQTFSSDVEYKDTMKELLGPKVAKVYESQLIGAAIELNATLVLIGILGFIASFAISLGPVTWVLFSELFPLSIKAIAISFVGAINSLVSFGVQFVFPWELSAIGSAPTFFIFAALGLLGLIFIIFKVPETKGKSLEELEAILIKK